MIKGLRSVIYPVSDLEKAKNWYSNVLNIQPYFEEPFYIGFNVGGYELGLLPDGKSGIDGSQAMWGVDDIESVYNRMIDNGAVEIEKINDVGGGIKIASVLDPFGNRFGLIFNPHFKITE
jgi:predicted enzyme related to lactoylglutathione lyase